MKKNRKLTKVMLFASTGAIMCSGLVWANDSQQQAEVERSQTYKTQETIEVRSDAQLDSSGARIEGRIMDEPAGAERRSYTTSSTHAQSFGTVQRASDIIGMQVRNPQNQNLGEVKDVMVDLHSGRIPFAVISTEGMGDRLVAVPPSAFRSQGRDLVLNIDRDRLRSAPSFERNRWPNMANQQWSSDVYRFYGAEPYWQSGSIQGGTYERRSEYYSETVSEPAGAAIYEQEAYFREEVEPFEDNNTLDDINKGSNTRGGAEDLQTFDEKANSWRGRTLPAQEAAVWQEPAGAGRGTHYETRRQQHTQTTPMAAPGISSMGRLHKASELVGMNVKNARGETVGEIQDVVLDMNSGHVAYTVIDAGRFLDGQAEFVAVPPSLFTYGQQGTGVMLNADRNVLMSAPRFERNNWTRVSDEQFVSRVYSHYGQQPYWQAQGFRQGTQFREPSGAEIDQRQYQEDYQHQEFQQDQSLQDPSLQQDQSLDPQSSTIEQRDESLEQQPAVDEPAGTDRQDLQLEQEEPESSLSDPAGAQPQSSIESEEQSSLSSDEQASSAELQSSETQAADAQASAPSAGFDVQSGAQIEEAAGAQPDAQVDVDAQAEAEVEQPAPPQFGEQQDQTLQAAPEISEPAGAQPGLEAEAQSETDLQAQQADVQHDELQNDQATPAQIEEPAGAEVHTTESAAQQVDEAAGAAAGDQSQKMAEQVKSSIQQQPEARNVQVSAENGKIVLRGSVNSETEKEQIAERVQQMILDNQIQVQGTQESETETQQP